MVFSDLCPYHAKFGDKAYKCVPPCPWKDRVAAIDFEVAETRRPTTWSSLSGWPFKKLFATFMGSIVRL